MEDAAKKRLLLRWMQVAMAASYIHMLHRIQYTCSILQHIDHAATWQQFATCYNILQQHVRTIHARIVRMLLVYIHIYNIHQHGNISCMYDTVCLSICLPICLAVCLSVWLSVHTYVHMTVCVYVCNATQCNAMQRNAI